MRYRRLRACAFARTLKPRQIINSKSEVSFHDSEPLRSCAGYPYGLSLALIRFYFHGWVVGPKYFNRHRIGSDFRRSARRHSRRIRAASGCPHPNQPELHHKRRGPLGRFNLNPDLYDITVSKPGFSESKLAGQKASGRMVYFERQLKVGATTTTVEVTASAGAELQTTNATVGSTISGMQLD